MRQLIIAAMLCTFSACSCGPSPCTGVGVGRGGTGGFGGAGGSGADVSPLFVGISQGVMLETTESFSSCTGSPVVVTGAEAEVKDPTNTKVASTVTMPTDFAGSVSVTVSFTPATPGPYHITVRFLPDLGTVQKDVLVAIDKSDAGEAHTQPLSPEVMVIGCRDIDIDETAAETVLCLTSPQGLYSIQNGHTVGSIWPASAFALSEGKVWAFSTVDNNLHVLGLGSDGSLTDLASAGPLDSSVTRVLAAGDQALVLSSTGFVQARLASDGGLSISSSVGVNSAQYVQWVPDVGAQVAGYGSADVCSFSLAGGVTTPLNVDAGICGVTGTSIDIVGFDDDGLWTRVDESMSNVPDLIGIDVTGWQPGQSRASSGSLSYGSQNMIGSVSDNSRQATPILYLGGQASLPTELYLPHFDGTQVTLTRYPFVAVGDAHADSKRLWTIDSSNKTLTWWPR